MTDNDHNVSIAHALLGVTESSINNDRALLGLCEVIADTVNLLEKRLSMLEMSAAETRGTVLALKDYLMSQMVVTEVEETH